MLVAFLTVAGVLVVLSLLHLEVTSYQLCRALTLLVQGYFLSRGLVSEAFSILDKLALICVPHFAGC